MSTYPREYASDTNFASGPDSGTPTKTDQGDAAVAQGSINGLPFLASFYNHESNLHSLAARAAIRSALLTLSPALAPNVAEDPRVSYEGRGVAFATGTGAVRILKGGWEISGGELIRRTLSVIDPVEAAVKSGLVAALGGAQDAGEQHNLDRSTSDAAWVNANFRLTSVIYDSTSDLFVAALDTSHLTSSADLSSFTARNLSDANTCLALAVNTAGLVVALKDASGVPDFDSAADAITYSDTGGTIVGTAEEVGDVCCDGNTFYWAGRLDDGTLSIQASTDGGTWAEVGSLAATSTATADDRTQIACDPSSGNVWVAYVSGTEWFLAASPNGTSWVGPVHIGPATTASAEYPEPALSVAEGRLYIGLHNRAMLRTGRLD